eukprot:CAMPEP_0113471992 /NCGR_PEP_ID=MMETSP0014_2-20120614/17275_1 /TAXON_ID=2857 /ORGANISM="Nitzschia sp." /LENGTH=1355 /DNA_ID=CAMNT_0000364667 /DNA_START=428 /DNA_END=4492 /DNA_ORIENTATION=- /assembly_acc=CAM_ASM_000159
MPASNTSALSMVRKKDGIIEKLHHGQQQPAVLPGPLAVNGKYYQPSSEITIIDDEMDYQDHDDDDDGDNGEMYYDDEEDEFEWIHRLDAPILVLKLSEEEDEKGDDDDDGDPPRWSVSSCNAAAAAVSTATATTTAVTSKDKKDDAAAAAGSATEYQKTSSILRTDTTKVTENSSSYSSSSSTAAAPETEGEKEEPSNNQSKSELELHLSSQSEKLLRDMLLPIPTRQQQQQKSLMRANTCTIGIVDNSSPSKRKHKDALQQSQSPIVSVRQFLVHAVVASSKETSASASAPAPAAAVHPTTNRQLLRQKRQPQRRRRHSSRTHSRSSGGRMDNTNTTKKQKLVDDDDDLIDDDDDDGRRRISEDFKRNVPAAAVSIVCFILQEEEGIEIISPSSISPPPPSVPPSSSSSPSPLLLLSNGVEKVEGDHESNDPVPVVVDEDENIDNRANAVIGYNYDDKKDDDDDDDEYRRIVESSCSLVFGVDRNGRVNEWNHSMEQLTGISKSEASGFPLISSTSTSTGAGAGDASVDAAAPAPAAAGGGGIPSNSHGDENYESGSEDRNYYDQSYDLDEMCPNDGDGHNDHENGESKRPADNNDDLSNGFNNPPIDDQGFCNSAETNIMERLFMGSSMPVGTREYDDIPEEFQTILYNALCSDRGTSNFELELKILPPADTGKDDTNSPNPVEEDEGPGGQYDDEDDLMEVVQVETHFLLTSVSPRRDIHGAVTGAIVIATDITEACNHDRAVAAMANELRQLIDTANACVFGCDCDGDVNEWNDKTAEVTGYTKDEAFDFPLVESFIVPELQAVVQDILDNALDGRATSNYELEFRTKSQEVRHLLVNFTPQRDMYNFIVGVVAIAQDVTEAVQRDRAVAGMALELRQLIDTANAPICGIDIEGNINEWNNRMSEVTGYSKEESFDENLVDFCVAPSMKDEVEEILASALAGNETSNYELEFVSKSGEPIFLLVNATTRRDPSNDVVGVVGVAQDVTEDRKHSKDLREMHALRASQEAKVETERNMTAYFAHELRNPLGAIDSALSAMPDDLPDSARSLVAGMQLCTGFMSSIMNNLLDVRKMEEGKMRLARSPISLEKMVKSVHKMLMPSVRKDVDFRIVEKKIRSDWVLGDAHRIQQVLTNVVTNAIKYTVSGHIELSLDWEGDYVKFACEDTGPGIPKSEQEKLFQRFVQRGGAPGTGLGLAIAKNLVDLVGGSIRFDSDPSVKAGTTCIVLLKLEVCQPPEGTVEENTALIEEPLTILIIDDIKMNRMMLKRRIMKGIAPNASIREAATGEEALEICGSEKFDVIIVDQYMEEAGGILVGTDVVFAMRRMRIESIIIGCSGNDLEGEFKESGANYVW